MLVISMSQYGYENMILWNQTDRQMEFFDLLFCDSHSEPQLGNIIAFTDGIFDESLWQNESWYYGYQFAKSALNNNTGELVVERGCSLSYTLTQILLEIQEREAHGFTAPTVRTYNFQTNEAKTLLKDLQSFQNGVFVPVSADSYRVTFRRYINGCPTNEEIEIDIATEQITYSEYRFTQEDMASIVDLSKYIESTQPAAEQDIPAPRHFDPEGKEAWAYGCYGWYEKTEDAI